MNKKALVIGGIAAGALFLWYRSRSSSAAAPASAPAAAPPLTVKQVVTAKLPFGDVEAEERRLLARAKLARDLGAHYRLGSLG